MDPSFFYNLVLSFVVGSTWVTLTNVIAEKYGSKIGGFIGGLPSTVVVALLFIALTQTTPAAIEATTIMPVAQGLNGLFTISYILSIRRGLTSGLTSHGPWRRLLR
jgi:Ca2+/H+ antiporter